MLWQRGLSYAQDQGCLTSSSARHPKPLLREGRSLVFVSKASRGVIAAVGPPAPPFPSAALPRWPGSEKPRFSSRSLIAVAINTCTVVSSAAATPFIIRLTLGSRWAPTSTSRSAMAAGRAAGAFRRPPLLSPARRHRVSVMATSGLHNRSKMERHPGFTIA